MVFSFNPATLEFRDILYGSIAVPEYILPAIRAPEFVRLRGVSLSNVDSYQFKDLSPSRWAHGVAVAGLAWRCARLRCLTVREEAHLVLAGLLHDVATPPFAHTAEYVVPNFDHEVESRNILAGRWSEHVDPATPVFNSELPQFEHVCATIGKPLGVHIDREEVASTLCGQGELGWLVAGTLDLDNADNVVRACLHMGIDVDRQLPHRLVKWLACQPGPVVELDRVNDPDVALWREYRAALYEAFYSASEEELGRQAFLQHLMRHALADGLPRHSLLWNTDEGLLLAFMSRKSDQPARGRSSLAELTRRYRSLEPVHLVLTVPIEDVATLREVRLPQFAAWLERQLQTDWFEPFVTVSARRSGRTGTTLFDHEVGQLQIFRLASDELKAAHLPAWLASSVDLVSGRKLKAAVAKSIRDALPQWIQQRPWLSEQERVVEVKDALGGVGDWSFRLSTNDNLHPYPSTFVHAIPATLLSALGVRGELVIDPFGGTGQTAAEVIKTGGSAVTADISYVATLAASARFEFLSREVRKELLEFAEGDVRAFDAPAEVEIADALRWHDRRTLDELRTLLGFINTQGAARSLLLTTFSAVLTNTTGRRGEQHGFFADNTPLARGRDAPPYVNAIGEFVAKLRLNVAALERFYAQIERADREPEEELARVSVQRRDASSSTAADYRIEEHSAAAVITSPPYLCMADYSLGSRLSYYWLVPEQMAVDFEAEIGARRRRSDPRRALEQYRTQMGAFSRLCASMCRTGGFVALVLGQPTARAFEGVEVFALVDGELEAAGFESVWSTMRDISWSRNFGYRRLRRERVSVHRHP